MDVFFKTIFPWSPFLQHDFIISFNRVDLTELFGLSLGFTVEQ